MTLKLQGQGHGCSQRARSYIGPSILLICVLFISHQSDQQFLTAISKFDLETSKVKVMSEVKGQGHISYPVPFRFTSIGPTIPEIWPKQSLTLKKHIRIFYRKFAKITVSNRTSPKSSQVITMTREILQTSKFLLIYATTVTLGQGHEKVIQYILPDLYIVCPKYLRCS